MATAQSVFTLAVCILMITELILAEKDYYDILGVPKDANERQIKKAFHKLAMRCHPDRNKSQDAEAKFREIAEAYETLSDDKRRREYDQSRHGSFSKEGWSSEGGQHQPFSFSFEDMFRDFDIFGQNQHSQQKRHSEERHFQAQQETRSQHRRHFQGSFGQGVFNDVFEDMERMFSFDRHSARTEGGFHGSAKQHCRTVTQRRGNMVSTYMDCSSS